MYADYATGSPASATEQPGLAPVLVGFAGSAPQSRLTVLFRYFLLMSFLVLGVLFSVGCGATAGAAHGNGVSAANATNQVQANTTPVTDAVNNYAANVALVASVSRAASVYARLGAATSANQYISEARTASLASALNQVNQDYA